MTLAPRHGGWTITASFIAALMLVIFPLPEWAEVYRPEWVTMVLVYWCMAVPQRVGVGIGWSVGLLEDVLRGALLGQHALTLALIAYITLALHQRLRVFPLWQQSLVVLMLVTLELMLVLWVKGIVGYTPGTWAYWLPAVTSALFWPWLFVILRDLRRRFQVR